MELMCVFIILITTGITSVNGTILTTQKSVFPLSQEVKEGLSYLKDKTFEKSDHFIGRNLSCLIKLSWTEAEVKQRALTMAKLIREVTA